MSDHTKPVGYYAPDGEVTSADLYHRILRIEEENKRLVAVVSALRRQEQSALLMRWREEAKIREDISSQRQQLELKLRRLEMGLMNFEAKPAFYAAQLQSIIQNLQPPPPSTPHTLSYSENSDGGHSTPADPRGDRSPVLRSTWVPVSDELSSAGIPFLERGFKVKEYVQPRNGAFTRLGRGGSDLTFVYGPYVTLIGGRYKALVDIEVGLCWPKWIEIDAAIGTGKSKITSRKYRIGPLRQIRQLEFEFFLSEEINLDAEVRFSAPANAPVGVRDIRLFRLDEGRQKSSASPSSSDARVTQGISDLANSLWSANTLAMKDRISQLEHDFDQKLQVVSSDTQRVLRERWDTFGSVLGLGLVEFQEEATAQVWAAETRHYDFMMELQRRLESLNCAQASSKVTPLAELDNLSYQSPARNLNNIAFFLRTLSPGGLERVVADLALGFNDAGRQVTIIVELPLNDIRNMIDVGAVRVISLPDEQKTLRRILEGEHIDVLSIHHAYNGLEELDGWSGVIVETIHNYYAWQSENIQLRELRTRLIPRFIAVSHAVADYSIRKLGVPKGSITVIPNSHWFRNFIRPTSSRLQSLRSRSEKFHFVHVANFYPVKAHSTLLRAFKALLTQVPIASLDLVGQDVELIKETVQQLGISGSVTIHGNLSQRDMSAIYARAHCFVLPSIIEGWSMSVMEAMYFELPLILSDVGSARDLIVNSDIGIIVPAFHDVYALPTFEDSWLAETASKYDVAPLVKAMADVANNYERHWMRAGRSAREKLSQYDLESMMEKYDAAFHLIAAAVD